MTPGDHAEAPLIPPWPDGWRVEEVASTTSTNDDLVERAADLADRTVRRADYQTAGRGRLDRRWDAPAGTNLLVSILFRRPPTERSVNRFALGQIRRVSLAVAATITRLHPDLCPQLKWPNDVMIGSRKIAGLLTQLTDDGSVVVGIGLNVGWAPAGAIALAPDGSLTPRQVLVELLAAFDRLPESTDQITDAYTDLLATLGREVRIDGLDGRSLVGRAVSVDPDGALQLIDADGVTHRVEVGDVIHLRPA